MPRRIANRALAATPILSLSGGEIARFHAGLQLPEEDRRQEALRALELQLGPVPATILIAGGTYTAVFFEITLRLCMLFGDGSRAFHLRSLDRAADSRLTLDDALLQWRESLLARQDHELYSQMAHMMDSLGTFDGEVSLAGTDLDCERPLAQYLRSGCYLLTNCMLSDASWSSVLVPEAELGEQLRGASLVPVDAGATLSDQDAVAWNLAYQQLFRIGL